MNQKKLEKQIKTDVLIVGAGIMGATFASILKELDSKLKIDIVDMLEEPGSESTSVLNNAGTGHAGYCELNYTPLIKKKVDIKKAIDINAKFEVSMQFWSYLVQKYEFIKPKYFITKTPHISIVSGENDIRYLKKRYDALKKHHLFKGIEFSKNSKIIEKWMPLLKNHKDKLAATKVDFGSDVNFENITKYLIQILKNKKNFKLHNNVKANSIHLVNNKLWSVKTENLIQKKQVNFNAKFVFIASGGQSINLLQKTKILQQVGYAGFPVNGKWLICKNQKINQLHNAKTYSRAAIGSPPMSLPHIDLRIVNGEKILLFGPFASFTFKFLKFGSNFDLIRSINFKNLKVILYILFKEWKLLLYLIKQTFISNKGRMSQLKKFYPNANSSDWSLYPAGIRVQIIKPSKVAIADLEFGTEIIYNDNKNLAALLGASPGASVAVSSMLEIVDKCFNNKKSWKKKIKKIIPASADDLIQNPFLIKKIRSHTLKALNLN